MHRKMKPFPRGLSLYRQRGEQNGELTVQGVVVSPPQVIGRGTGFLLRTDRAVLRVLRQDRAWQLRDLIFLEPGQHVAVTGRQEAFCLWAQKILILSGVLWPGEGEDVHGDPLHPAAACGGEGIPGR